MTEKAKRQRGRPKGTKESEPRVMVGDLTLKEWRFVYGYLKHFNRVKAYKDAGYKAKDDQACHSNAYQLLNKPKIREIVDTLGRNCIQEKLKAEDIDIPAITDMYLEILQRSMQHRPVLDENGLPTGKYTYDPDHAITVIDRMAKHLSYFPPKEVSIQKHSTQTKVTVNAKEILDKLPQEAKLAMLGRLLEKQQQQLPNGLKDIVESNGVHHEPSSNGGKP